MQTLLLDPATWDLVLDSSANIAVASDPYSMAQDAASEIRTFQGEDYYDTAHGVPYWTLILGKAPPLALMKQKFVAAAMLVPGVVSAKCFIASLIDRALTGQVQITSASGQTSVAGFGVALGSGTGWFSAASCSIRGGV